MPAHRRPADRPRPTGLPAPAARGTQQGTARRTGGVAPVYDVDGPRVRFGALWFLVAVPAVVFSPQTTVLVYGLAAGLAARQIAREWKVAPWQIELAAVLAALPVAFALGGEGVAGGALAAVAAVAVLAAFGPAGPRYHGPRGHMATVGVLVAAVVPAAAGAALVLVRVDSAVAAVVLVLMVSAYEAGDFIVGSGTPRFLEGPLAGGLSAVVVGFPFSLLLLAPFDGVGLPLLAFVVVLAPLGQMLASATLPSAGARAPALRRIDSLLVLAPVWVVAVSVF